MKNPIINFIRRRYAPAIMVLLGAALALGAGCAKTEKTPEEKAKEAAATVQKAHDRFKKGTELLTAKKFEEAIRELEESVKLNDNSAEAHSNLGYAYADKFVADIEKFNAAKEKAGNEKPDAALLDKSIQHHKRSVEINPNHVEGYYGLALSLEHKGDFYGALENWKIFLKLSPGKSVWSDNAKKHVKTIDDFIKKALKEAKKKSKAPQDAVHGKKK